MAAEVAEDVARFGRQIASAQGFDPNTPGFDAYQYGREARYQMGRRPPHGVPDPRDFVAGGHTAAAPHRATPHGAEGNRVRIGRIEMRLADAEPARNRPQHPHHAGQRSSGRWRLVHRSYRWKYRRR